MVPAAARFVHVWAGTFAVLTIVDPLAGGPLMRALGLADAPIATIVMVAFVLLGDFRVYLLVFTLMTYAGTRHDARVADPRLRGARRAAAGAAARRARRGARDARRADRRRRRRGRAPRRAIPNLPAQSIWLAYELAFLVVALVLRNVDRAGARAGRRAPPPQLSPHRPHLRRGLLRALGDRRRADPRRHRRRLGAPHVPNQLYYAFWVPFAYGMFFARR